MYAGNLRKPDDRGIGGGLLLPFLAGFLVGPLFFNGNDKNNQYPPFYPIYYPMYQPYPIYYQ